jgi:hypothetical protein
MKSGENFQKIRQFHPIGNLKFQEGTLEQSGGFLSLKGLAHPEERMENATILSREMKLRLIGDEGNLLRTTKHIIDESAVYIFTTWTNELKKGFMVFHVIFFIDQFFLMNRIVAERTEYHPAPHH